MDIADTDFSTYITFHEDEPNSPPFQIENDTPLTLTFAQRKTAKEAGQKFHQEDFTGIIHFLNFLLFKLLQTYYRQKRQ